MKYFTAPRIGTLWNSQAKPTTSWTHGEKAQINYEEHAYETCMKHVWTTTCTFIYIYIHIITSVYFRVGGIRVTQRANVSRGYSARRSRNAEMAYLQATGYQVFQALHPFRKLAKCEWKGTSNRWSSLEMSRTWYNTISSPTEKNRKMAETSCKSTAYYVACRGL